MYKNILYSHAGVQIKLCKKIKTNQWLRLRVRVKLQRTRTRI